MLWFYPDGGVLGADGRNEVEAKGFEALRDEFAKLDSVAVGCSSQPAEAVARLCATAGLTSPMLRDPGSEAADAWGARRSFPALTFPAAAAAATRRRRRRCTRQTRSSQLGTQSAR